LTDTAAAAAAACDAYVLQKAGAEVVAVEDPNWREEARGLPGQQLGLTLMLRVVADVGLVGFPNAGEAPGYTAERGRTTCRQMVFSKMGCVCVGGGDVGLVGSPNAVEGQEGEGRGWCLTKGPV
jgi:GTPase involved in cell partitioning and DNA repair